MSTHSTHKMAERTHREKKRKREKDGSSKPSKRVAIEEEDKQIKMSLMESGKWAPVIGMCSPFRRKTLPPDLNAQGLTNISLDSGTYTSFFDLLGALYLAARKANVKTQEGQ